MLSLINTRQFVANKYIKTAFATNGTYCNSLENLNQFISKFSKAFYSEITMQNALKFISWRMKFILDSKAKMSDFKKQSLLQPHSHSSDSDKLKSYKDDWLTLTFVKIEWPLVKIGFPVACH